MGSCHKTEARSQRSEGTPVKYASLVTVVPHVNIKERFKGVKISRGKEHGDD